jgi:hypothetical protein
MYGEDADLCLRAKRLGGRAIVTSSAKIIHYGGASEKVREDMLVKLLKAKVLLIRRHFHPRYVKAGVFLLSAWPLTRWGAHSFLTLLGRSSSRHSADTWRWTWGRRKEWLAE